MILTGNINSCNKQNGYQPNPTAFCKATGNFISIIYNSQLAASGYYRSIQSRTEKKITHFNIYSTVIWWMKTWVSNKAAVC